MTAPPRRTARRLGPRHRRPSHPLGVRAASRADPGGAGRRKRSGGAAAVHDGTGQLGGRAPAGLPSLRHLRAQRTCRRGAGLEHAGPGMVGGRGGCQLRTDGRRRALTSVGANGRMRTARYFEEQVPRKRPYIEPAWCADVAAARVRRKTQPDGRMRFWGMITRPGETAPRILRAVAPADGETVRSAVRDRGFRKDEPRSCNTIPQPTTSTSNLGPGLVCVRPRRAPPLPPCSSGPRRRTGRSGDSGHDLTVRLEPRTPSGPVGPVHDEFAFLMGLLKSYGQFAR